MLKLLKKLHKIRLLTVAGAFHFGNSMLTEGINLMTLLRLAAKLHDRKIALTDEKESVSYRDLYDQSQTFAAVLYYEYDLRPKQKTALICRNHISLIRSIFAVSRLGSDIYLLNPEMSADQFKSLNERHSFDLLIYDAEVAESVANSGFRGKSIVANDENFASVEHPAKVRPARVSKIKNAYSSNIIVLTGGTTGQPKTAKRRASVLNFLNPFFALLTELNLDEYEKVYVATPVYHGFGVAAVFIGLILGSEMFLVSRFEARKACDLIERNRIEAVTLVPLMLQRMLNLNANALTSLACVVSGGAPLNPTLVEETFDKLGDKLFNLYGTSEAGFSVMATPEDLRYSSNTIGKTIPGLKLKILDAANKETAVKAVGRICIKSSWSVKDSGGNWIETGDLGFRDELGYYFLCGRTDEMIVSGGENVYPVELENILIKHPEIRQVAVIGVPDADFGQRLKAFIVPVGENTLEQTEINRWLSTRVARFQMPVAVVFLKDLPVTSVGKINKKSLS